MPNREDSQHRIPFVILFFGVGTILGLFSAVVLDFGSIGLIIGGLIGLATAALYIFIDVKRQS
jgi:nicotinamide riboside transporter PnuC